jgi:hypothetical protein
VASGWWADRSAVTYLAAARRGAAPRDSVLDRQLTPEERARMQVSHGLHDTFLRLRREWREERFREEYKKNFPDMD